MAEHTVEVSRRWVSTSGFYHIWIRCPDCDLRGEITIRPADEADELIAALTTAHQQITVGADHG